MHVPWQTRTRDLLRTISRTRDCGFTFHNRLFLWPRSFQIYHVSIKRYTFHKTLFCKTNPIGKIGEDLKLAQRFSKRDIWRDVIRYFTFQFWCTESRLVTLVHRFMIRLTLQACGFLKLLTVNNMKWVDVYKLLLPCSNSKPLTKLAQRICGGRLCEPGIGNLRFIIFSVLSAIVFRGSWFVNQKA